MSPRRRRIGRARWGSVPRADRETVITTMRDDASMIREEPMWKDDEDMQRYTDALDSARRFLLRVEETPGRAGRVDSLLAILSADPYDVVWGWM